MVSSSGDTFAGHSDQLKRLKAQLTHRAPPSRSVSGGSVESSQADLPISPAPQSIPPRRSLPAQRALERVAEVQGSGVLTVESVPSQRRVRKQHVGVGGGTEPELREAKSLIETLRTQVDKHSAALHDSNARSEAAEHVVQRLRGELNVAHAELREADEAAKQAMQAREEHHAKEKSEMLQVCQNLQAEMQRYETSSTAQENDDVESMRRRLAASETYLREFAEKLSVEQGHSEELTQRLRELSSTHQVTLDELALLQEEQATTSEAHRNTIQAMKSSHQSVQEDSRQDRDRAKLLATRLREAEETELQMKCAAAEMQEEIAFHEAAREDHTRSTDLLHSEIQGLKDIVASMEGGWEELDIVRAELREANSELETARGSVHALHAKETEAQQHLAVVSSECAELQARLAKSTAYAQELEVIMSETTSAADALAGCFPHLTGDEATLPKLVSACRSAVAEKDALLADLRTLRQEHLDITLTLDGVHEQIDNDRQRADAAVKRSDQDKAAYEALLKEVQDTQLHVQHHETHVQKLEEVASQCRRDRDEAAHARDAASTQARQLERQVSALQLEMEQRSNESSSATRTLLSKVQSLREEERAAHQMALADMNTTAERNRRQRTLIDTLEAEITTIRSTAMEALQAMHGTGMPNIDNLSRLVEELRSSNARFGSVHEAELLSFQKEIAALKIENNRLHMHCDQQGAKRDELRTPQTPNITQTLLTYQTTQEEAQRELASVMSQKQSSEQELADASNEVLGLRQQLQHARTSRVQAEQQNSVLTSQLSRTRVDAQEQQRILLSEIDCLMHSG